jgi:Phytanoyl-CoA dioxygenase (PhyH)
MHLIRFYLRKSPWLIRWARITRAMIMLGPGRGALLRLCQNLSKCAAPALEPDRAFTDVNVDKIVAHIENNGYAHIARLSSDYLSEILDYCEQNNQSSYWNPHQNCDAIDRLARNEKLVEIARNYLGAEPKLWLTQLRWTFCAEDQNRSADARRKNSADYNFHDFHYDCRDFKSVTFFIYLSDVTMDSGPHMFVRGTHKNKTLRELMNISISDDFAKKLYGDKIQVVLGEKGTIFAEDTSCYHKAAVCEKASRLIASFDYVVRKKAPPVPFSAAPGFKEEHFALPKHDVGSGRAKITADLQT